MQTYTYLRYDLNDVAPPQKLLFVHFFFLPLRFPYYIFNFFCYFIYLLRYLIYPNRIRVYIHYVLKKKLKYTYNHTTWGLRRVQCDVNDFSGFRVCPLRSVCQNDVSRTIVIYTPGMMSTPGPYIIIIVVCTCTQYANQTIMICRRRGHFGRRIRAQRRHSLHNIIILFRCWCWDITTTTHGR